jgi:hypothetical protein
VLSYTTRDWFQKPQSNEDLLRRRLLEEEAALREMQAARQRAEARLATMERERDFYKLLAIRWQTRMRVSRRQGRSAMDDEDDDVLIGDDELPRLLASFRGGGEGSEESEESEGSDEDNDEDLVSLADVEDDTAENDAATALSSYVHVDGGASETLVMMEDSP